MIQCQGWQSPFATETGGLFQTDNSVASAGQASAALNYTYSSFPQYIQAVAPIYYRGMGLICIPLSGVGHPAVILNLVRDDLRMMAPKPVVAREGGMKDIADNCDYYP